MIGGSPRVSAMVCGTTSGAKARHCGIYHVTPSQPHGGNPHQRFASPVLNEAARPYTTKRDLLLLKRNNHPILACFPVAVRSYNHLVRHPCLLAPGAAALTDSATVCTPSCNQV